MKERPALTLYNNEKTANFLYDGENVRAKKYIGAWEHYYIGEHMEIKNGMEVEFLFAGNMRVAQLTSSTSAPISYFHKDHLNSTTVLTDGSGNEVGNTEYTPYGVERSGSITAPFFADYKYTDQEFDSGIGLYNYNARLYDPALGLFISFDSVVANWYNPQNLNRYSYCFNNPLIYTDPTGHITTGEALDDAAYRAVSSKNPFVSYGLGFALTFVKTSWDYLGAEGTSKVYDNLITNRDDLTAMDVVSAGFEIGEAVTGAKFLLKGGGKLASVGVEAVEELSEVAQKSATIQTNKMVGSLGEDAVRARLLDSNSVDLIGEQVRINTPGVGSHRVTDFLVRGKNTGKLRIIEVKTGNATRDATQLAKDKLIADPLSPTTFSGRRARAAGFPNGTPTGPINTYEVNASNLRY